MKSLQTRKRERPWSDSHTVQLVKQRGMQGRATTTLMSRTPRSMVRWSSSLLLPRPLDPRHVREIFKIRERPWPKPCPNSRDKEVQLSVTEREGGKILSQGKRAITLKIFFPFLCSACTRISSIRPQVFFPMEKSSLVLPFCAEWPAARTHVRTRVRSA